MARRRRKHRARYRRNPPVGRGIVGKLVGGVKNAASIVAGKAAARAIPQALGLPQTGATGIAVQIGAALAAGMLADRFAGGRIGEFVLAGALAAPLESAIKKANVPFLSPALAGDDEVLLIDERAARSYGLLGAYDSAPAPGETLDTEGGYEGYPMAGYPMA